MAEPPDNDVPDGFKAIQQQMAAEAVRLAGEGDTEAARDILRGFIEAALLTDQRDWPAQLPVAWVQYLADAFRQILDSDADAARALGLKSSKAGRPQGTKTHDEVRLAAAYWLMVRRGVRPERANERIRQATGADRTTIQGASKRCSAFEDRALVDDDILLSIIAEQPALSEIVPA